MNQIQPQDLSTLQQNILYNLRWLNTNKYLIAPNEFHELVNYHTRTLAILNGLQKPIITQERNVERGRTTGNSYEGTAVAQWETQYNPIIQNPPMYSLPSNNVWSAPPFSSK